MDPVIQTIVSIVSAIIAASMGYLKNRPSEEFDKAKFAHTVLIGLAVGILQVVLGLTPGSAEGYVVQFLIQTGLIDTIEKALKALWNRYQATQPQPILDTIPASG